MKTIAWQGRTYQVGEKVMLRRNGKLYTVTRIAKPVQFDIGCGADRHIETMPAYDLVEGDDVRPDSFDVDFVFGAHAQDISPRDTRWML